MRPISQRLVSDETGMTMALTVIMIVLIGVMGAGLLAFVQSDLKSVIEVNRGQKALDIAEAGVQAAKSHLRVDSFRQHYDTLTTAANDCAEGPRVGGDNWSKATTVWTATNGACSGGPIARSDVSGTPWREDVGVSKTFGGGQFHVTIECFDQNADPTPDPCVNAAGPAPNASAKAEDTKFFKITSTGYSSADGTGAIRKIEAIYTTSLRTYAPVAYWTPGNILFTGGGSTTVSKMSFFAGNNIQGVRKTSAGTSIADRTTPAIYGNWAESASRNTTPRKTLADQSVVGAGFAAVGFVCGTFNQACDATTTSNHDADGINDYDSTTATLTTSPTFKACITSRPTPQRCIKFEANPGNPTPSNRITFPFDPRSAITNPPDVVDPGLVEEMRSAAQTQGYYSTGNQIVNSWPVPGQEITYFVQGGNLKYSATNGAGLIIVKDGNFELAANSYFKGVVIVIGDGSTAASGTGKYESAGNGVLDGYVSASGDITIRGNVSPSLSLTEITLLNNFLDVKLWSWRELYQ
jgi:hypothetical protein